MEGQQTRPCAIIYDEPMEIPIQIKYLRLLPAPFPYLEQAFIQFSELTAEFRSLRSWQRRNTPPGNAFQVSDDEVEFVRVLFRQRSNDHAGFADVPVFEDVPLALQPVDSAADRSPAHIQPLGQIGLQNPCSRR